MIKMQFIAKSNLQTVPSPEYCWRKETNNDKARNLICYGCKSCAN